MKRIDKSTQKKLYWLFLPMAFVIIFEMLYLLFDYDALNVWFGCPVSPLEWISPALMGCVILLSIGFSIAAIIQKCWGELVIGLVFIIIILLNMSDFFVKLF